MKRVCTGVASLLLLLAPLLVVAPADAGSVSWRGVLTFDKNWHNQFNSRVIWRLYERPARGRWKLVQTRSWRAGAGLPGRGGRNACLTSRGWLPNGTYRLRQHNDYHGNVIKGRAFRLDDKACANGRVRHNLFLHSEQGPGNRQCRDRRGDQACRWEWPRINDYKSLGCIKMAPRDLAQLVSLFHRHFAAGVRYGTGQVSLRVVS